jgi:hypothetical protein
LLMKGLFALYRPELHYMRGPGPRTDEKRREAASRVPAQTRISWRRLSFFSPTTSDDRRTAESLIAIDAHEIQDIIVELTKSKQLSIVMRNLNRLMQHPTDHELGRRSLRHLGFLDD